MNKIDEKKQKAVNLLLTELFLKEEFGINIDVSSQKKLLLGSVEYYYGDDMADALVKCIEETDWTNSETLAANADICLFVDKVLQEFDQARLEERAIEIDANGKAYAVQDSLVTQKTKDATGHRDISIKNGTKDPNLTQTEKDIVLGTVETLKKLGKLKDINKEFNVSNGPDIVYMPIDDKVKITPDNGSAPYKIKIPEAVRPLLKDALKTYEFDLLENICMCLNNDKVEECKKALETNFKITETITGKELNKYGYLENEGTLFKLEEK